MGIITLAEAKAQLDIESTVHDTELQAYIDGMTAPIENLVGVVEPREVTETVDGTGTTLCLLKVPALALVSITPQLTGGAALDVAQLHLDGATGIVRRLTGGRFYGGPWTARYTVGRTEDAATIKLAARILIQHLWRTQYGASRGLMGVGGGDDYSVTEPIPGFGYAVPNRVLELLEPYKLPPGVA
ncbi:phage gp6-like head-tail connector protein [Streptomyces luteocolor]|uniref:phage gp6-like head-tail connector protein n=1 Tax=Streptomyces luteocolor TaxID=285500 RepID=UPI00085353C8|nr:phage gp6-like head-tail connector protein [Streptomyces luteocolor]